MAAEAHAGQVRKFNGRPYITHPARVAALAMLLRDATPEMVAAAWLHDVVEDCGVVPRRIRDEFGDIVADLVEGLTHTMPADHPEWNRTDRHGHDRRRLASASRAVRLLKLLDRLDNLRELDDAPHDFRVRYLHESRQLLDEALSGVDADLEAELRAEIARHETALAEG